MLEPGPLRTQLKSLTTRASKRSEAIQWATGELRLIPEDILPHIPDQARRALIRLASMAQSLGPRIVGTTKFGTLGGVNWGGDNTTLDALLREQDLEAVADELLTEAVINGMAAGVTRRDPTGAVRIEPLIGHTEVIPDPASPTVAAGFIHAWVDDRKWTVRVYDFAERSMREWRQLTDPARAVGRAPDVEVLPSAEYPQGAPMPRFAVIDRAADRTPLGLIRRNLRLIKSDWSSQIRGDRAEENTAFPQLKVSGEVADGTNERSSSHVIRLIEGGDAGFILPGDLSQIHRHHDRKLERIREDANMPGGFLGTQTPSGEALREQNAKFINMCKRYAQALTRVLTELAADLALAHGFTDAPEVSVLINREFEKENEIQRIIQLFNAGLLERAAAIRAISVHVPTWSDEEVEAFITGQVNPPAPANPAENQPAA